MTLTCESCIQTNTVCPCDTPYADGECPKQFNKELQPMSVILVELLRASDEDKPSDKAD